MKRRRYRCGLAGLFLLTLAAASAAHAQAGDYPAKSVTIIADAAPGASPDVAARFVAEALGKIWRQQVAVINHPGHPSGANGSIAARAAADAAPGEVSFQFRQASWRCRRSRPNLPLKLPRDFLPIEFIRRATDVRRRSSPSLGVTTLAQLIALAKKQPGTVSIALSEIGRMTHLTGELLQARADIKLLSVPYMRGPAVALGDVASRPRFDDH